MVYTASTTPASDIDLGALLPPRRERPSLETILGLKVDSEQYFKAFHDQCARADAFFENEYDIPAPKGFDPIHSGIARSLINVAVDHVDVSNIAIDVPLASPRAKARAEKLKKFYIGFWSQVKKPVLRTTVRHCFLYGVGFQKTMFRSDQWPDAPQADDYVDDASFKEALDDFMERRGIANPIHVETVNPQRIVWDMSKTGPHWFIESYERREDEVYRLYPQWRSKRKDDVCSWTEYWDDTHYVYMADDEIVEEGEHGYGFLPYELFNAANTIDHDDRPPHLRYQGMLHALYDLISYHDRTLTAEAAMIRATAWRTIDFIGDPQKATQARDNYEIFGGMNVVPSGVEVKPSPYIQLPPELLNHREGLASLIEQGSYPNVVRGVRPRGVSTGFAVSVLAGMGRLVFQGVADAMGRGIEGLNKKVAMLVENKLRGRLTVHARSDIHNFDQTIGPEDIRGYYETRVTLKAESPEEREREAILALRLWNNGNGLISLYEAQRRAAVPQPLEMQAEQMSERALFADPAVAQAFSQMLLERIGLLNQLAAVAGVGPLPEGANMGQFQAGASQMQRPGEASIQRQRVATNQANASVFPRGLSGLDALGGQLGTPTGGSVGLPNGATVGG